MAIDLKFRLTPERIQSIPLFNNLNFYEAETLMKITSTRVVKENELIFKEGTPGDALFVILEGTVDIVKQVDQNNYSTLARFFENHAFGEMTLIFDEVSNRSASAIARKRTRLLIIHKPDFKQLIDFGSIIAYKVTLNLCRILSGRLSKVDSELVDLINSAPDFARSILQEFMNKRNRILCEEG